MPSVTDSPHRRPRSTSGSGDSRLLHSAALHFCAQRRKPTFFDYCAASSVIRPFEVTIPAAVVLGANTIDCHATGTDTKAGLFGNAMTTGRSTGTWGSRLVSLGRPLSEGNRLKMPVDRAVGLFLFDDN